MFVLLVIVFAANGVTSSAAYFADAQACKAAMQTIATEVASLKNQPVIYAHCAEAATRQASEKQ